MPGAFFSTAYATLDGALTTFLGEKLDNVIAIVRGPLAVGLAIYLALVGYSVLRGLVDEPWREWFYRILKLALIWAAVSSVGYNEWLAKPLSTDAPNAISQALSGNASDNAGTTFDTYFNRANPMVVKLNAYADTYSAVNPYRLIIYGAGILVWLLTGLSAVIGFAITLFAKIALVIVVALGPIFVALSLFNATRGMFFGFLNQAFNYIVLIGVIAAMTGLIISLGDGAAAAAEAATDPVFGSIIYDLYVVLGSVFFLQAPSIAAGIAGGAAAGVTDFARQTLGAGSATGRMFRANQSRADRRESRAANRAMARGGSISNNS